MVRVVGMAVRGQVEARQQLRAGKATAGHSETGAKLPRHMCRHAEKVKRGGLKRNEGGIMEGYSRYFIIFNNHKKLFYQTFF